MAASRRWSPSKSTFPLHQKHLVLRSIAQRCVSKDGQQTRCSFLPFETRACGPLLRVRHSGSASSERAPSLGERAAARSAAPRAYTGRPARTTRAPARSTTRSRTSAASSATTIRSTDSVGRHAEPPLPELAGPAFAHVAAQLVLGADELRVVVVRA